MKNFIYILSAVMFFSCINQNSPGLQDIINKWNNIDMLLNAEADPRFLDVPSLVKASEDFTQSLMEFQKSDLFRIYKTIPFSQQTARRLTGYFATDIPEVEIVFKLSLTFRDCVFLGDTQKAKTMSAEISRCLINLLIIDTDAQRYISSSYLNLLIALAFFIAVIMLLILFLHKSLTKSLMRETEAMIFSHSYMLAQDEERARISRELHDTIIQDMRFLLLETEKIGNTNEKIERELLSGKTTSMMADLIRKTRDICSSLIPPDFRFCELPDALRQLCFDFGIKTGIDCRAEIDTDIKLEFLSMEKRLQVFRIVQEALNNIEKHAEAKEAIVTMRGKLRSGLREEDDVIFIGISDDGKGFISPLDESGQIISGMNKSQIGIISMKERAAILGGRLRIESEIGEGTLVC